MSLNEKSDDISITILKAISRSLWLQTSLKPLSPSDAFDSGPDGLINVLSLSTGLNRGQVRSGLFRLEKSKLIQLANSNFGVMEKDVDIPEHNIESEVVWITKKGLDILNAAESKGNPELVGNKAFESKDKFGVIGEQYETSSLAGWRAKLSSIRQTPIGAQWILGSNRLEIDAAGLSEDKLALENALTRQLHLGTIRKSKEFARLSKRLSNSFGWEKMSYAADRFSDLVNGSDEEIIEALGFIYDAALTLFSYLDQDRLVRLSREQPTDPLDPDVFRALADLVQTAAPWLRRFPTIRELDEAAGAFLTASDHVTSAKEIAVSARGRSVVSREDAGAVLFVIDAAKTPGSQGQKAAARGVHTVRNLIVALAGVMATFYSGAVASDFSTRSEFVKRAGKMLAGTEQAVIKITEEMPSDIRWAIRIMLDELKGD